MLAGHFKSVQTLSEHGQRILGCYPEGIRCLREGDCFKSKAILWRYLQ